MKTLFAEVGKMHEQEFKFKSKVNDPQLFHSLTEHKVCLIHSRPPLSAVTFNPFYSAF